MKNQWELFYYTNTIVTNSRKIQKAKICLFDRPEENCIAHLVAHLVELIYASKI